MIAAVLAAGESQRFGSPKQLVNVEGRSMLAKVIAQLPQTLSEVIVITGAYRDQVEPIVLASKATCVFNPNFTDGLATSVKVAAEYASSKDSDLLLTLGDLPFVTKEDYLKLLDHFEGEVLFSKFGESYGPPAVFPRISLGRLGELQGDKGAKSLFPQAKSVDIPTAAQDIDHIQDL